ncbi:CDGSH iron-sulfur domain-containing protein [Kribbella sp. NPDC048915]|uniref:CDGSH iron-sulfur domain-containing protein n=1 Tax=Kribbella sp. NPDC048915 TaxID=3155148 RepID=UPI0033C4F24A
MTEIRAYPDGPLLVRGDFEILDENGEALPATRRTVALCRCGRSGIPPLCDGTHTLPVSRKQAQSPE